MVCPCNGILYSHKKQSNADTRYNIDDPEKMLNERSSKLRPNTVLPYLYEIPRIKKSTEIENQGKGGL